MESAAASGEEDDEEYQFLQTLFGEERETSSSSDESASDREWKEAVRAAVETEIQYQVQLRLAAALGGSEPGREDGVEDTAGTSTKLRRPPEREKRKLIHNTIDQDLPNEDTELTLSVTNKDEPRRLQDGTLSLLIPSRHNDSSKPTTDISTKPRQQTIQGSLYDYLASKYGTSREQLESLVKIGRYRCLPDEVREKIGVDKRVKWPLECNIIQRTPLHQATNKQSKIPMQFFEPLLGQQRRPALQTSLNGSYPVIYDSRVEDSEEKREGEGEGGGERGGGGEEESGGLKFESRFESGNLRQAVQIDLFEYNLVLSTDLYTERHTQWFYFKVSGMIPNTTYTFNIINFFKKDSLYNHGMKVLMYSEIDSCWQRVGYDISYRKVPHHSCPQLKQGVNYYYLSWKMEFTHSGDTCYFSHCYPYPFSSLLSLLDKLEGNERTKHYIKRQTLCETLAGNPCPLVTITDFDSREDCWSRRMGVVFTARVHPGETNSSWMMDGILNYLTSEHKHAKYLRSHFVFKIIPVLNPDGVIVGNYRTSLAGVDLNRVYKCPVEKIFPTVYNLKKIVTEFMEERKIALYVDLHGHSRNHNIFMYGCHTPQCDHTHFLQERVVPWLLSQISKEKFSFKSCKFAVQKCKESTGRVSLWRMGVANSFTMEASFCGTNLTRPNPLHFTQDDLIESGRDLCELLLKVQHYFKSASYQYKIHCKIAEYYLKKLEDPTSPSLEGEGGQVLPDIVTSTAEEANVERKRRERIQMSKCLRRFQTLSVRDLEEESSTSGSDSDNDEFHYKSRKNKNRHKRHKMKKEPHPSINHTRSTYKAHTTQEIKPVKQVPELVESKVIEERKVTRRDNKDSTPAKGEEIKPTANSAPPRLQRGSHPLHSWRFINKYSHRSNGGIPMFSEERSKERMEKQKLKSQSLIQEREITKMKYVLETDPTEAPPTTTPLAMSLATPTLPPIDNHPMVSSMSHSHFGATWSPKTHFPSLPIATEGLAHSREYPRKVLWKRRHSDTDGRARSLSHFQHIKGIIESHRNNPLVARQPQPHPQIATPLPSTLPSLPPELTKYISEIWRKHVQ